MKHCRAVLSSPTWRNSPYALRAFLPVIHETMPSRYNSAILEKLVILQENVKLFRFQLVCSKEQECLCCVGRFAKAGWKLLCFRNELWGSGVAT